MGEERRRGRSRGRPGKRLIPGGGVAKEIAELSLITSIDPLALMRTPAEVLSALYDGAQKLQERRRSRHG